MTYIKIGAVMVLVAALAGAKMYYTWSQEEIHTLQANLIKMELAVKRNEAVIRSLQSGIREAAKTHNTVSRKFAQTRRETTRLKNLLSKHDLGFLASKKPGLIQTRVNKGTANANRCFEIASGAPLMDSERNATKRSEINTSCPELANPRYKP